MFLDYPNPYTYGTATCYQYMYGTDFLVAPVYQATKADKEGNDIRNGIYLPKVHGLIISPVRNTKATVSSTILKHLFGSCLYL